MSRCATNRIVLLFAALAVAFLAWVAAGVTPSSAVPAAEAANATTYSGEACLLGGTLLGVNLGGLVECAVLPSEGGADEAGLVDVPAIGPLNGAEVFSGSTMGQGNESRTSTYAVGTSLTVAGNTIEAQALRADATAVCTERGPVLEGSSQVAQVTVNGTTYDVGTERLVIGPVDADGIGPLPPVTVIVNDTPERSGSGNYGQIDVRALTIKVGNETVYVVTAHADINCAGLPFCPNGKDFMTGGGWFHGLPPTDERRHFAGPAGIRNGEYWGHTVYMDKAAGIKAKGDVMWYGPSVFPDALDLARTPLELVERAFPGVAFSDETATRYRIGFFEGSGVLAAQPYLVRETDNGEPGRDDQWTIVFLGDAEPGPDVLYDVLLGSSGAPALYAATSEPGGLEGGNIQLHSFCK